MNKENAIKFLMENEGWNYDGAENIVETVVDDGIKLTKSNLKKLSEDHEDR